MLEFNSENASHDENIMIRSTIQSDQDVENKAVNKKEQRKIIKQLKTDIEEQLDNIQGLEQLTKTQEIEIQAYEDRINTVAKQLRINDKQARQQGDRNKAFVTPYNIHNVSQNSDYNYHYLLGCLSLISSAILTAGYFLVSANKGEFDRLKLKNAFASNITLHMIIFVLTQLFYDTQHNNTVIATPYYFKK